MNCPNCAATNPQESENCAACGVNFTKWEQKKQRESQVQGQIVSAKPVSNTSTGIWIIAAIALSAAFVLYRWIATPKIGNPEQPSQSQDSASATAVQVPPPSKAPDPTKLTEIAQLLNAELSAYSVSFDAADMRQHYEDGFKEFELYDFSFQYQDDLSAIGLSPLTQPATEEDGDSLAKCTKNGKTVYEIGSPDAGYSDCWRRFHQKEERHGSTVVIYRGDGPVAKTWMSYQWLPHMKMWALYSESDMIRAFSAHAEKKFGTAAQAATLKTSQEWAQNLQNDKYVAPADKAARLRDCFVPLARMRGQYAGAQARIEYENKRISTP